MYVDCLLLFLPVCVRRTLASSSLSSLSLFFSRLSTGAPAYSLQLPEGQIEEQYHIIVDDNDVVYGVVCRFLFLSYFTYVIDFFFALFVCIYIHTYLCVHTITGEYRKVVSSSLSLSLSSSSFLLLLFIIV